MAAPSPQCHSATHDVVYVLIEPDPKDAHFQRSTPWMLYGCCHQCRRIVFVRDLSEWADTVAEFFEREQTES